MRSFFPTSSVHVQQTGTWQSQLVVDFGWSKVETFCNSSDDLKRLMQLNFTQEYIRNITVYKHPLNDFQINQLLDNHQFVILETKNWWYSIEKNDHCIYMQRSKYIDEVQCYIRNICRRTPILRISYDFCKPWKTMGDLIQFLYDKNELNNVYHPMFSNCHAFAKRIFNKFASTKTHEIMLGCSPTFKVTPPWVFPDGQQAR